MVGVPRLTFMAVLGAVIARGDEHHDAFAAIGVNDWRDWLPRVDTAYGGFRPDDLYPDVLPALAGLRERGYRLAIVANQPARRTAELRALGVEADVVAMSEELGVAKPDPAFFDRALELMGSPDPGAVAYVGDRVDNDVIPAAGARMRAVWIRRGPWAAVQEPPLSRDGVPALVVASLDELVERIAEAW